MDENNELAQKLAQATTTGVNVVTDIEGACIATVVYAFVKGTFKPQKLWQKVIVGIAAYAIGQTAASVNSDRVNRMVRNKLIKLSEILDVNIDEEDEDEEEEEDIADAE